MIPKEFRVDLNDSDQPLPKADLIRRLEGKDGLICHIISTIDDEVLQAIAELPHLQSVMLYHTHITNRGLQALDKLPQLRHVHLVGCPHASVAPINELAKAP